MRKLLNKPYLLFWFTAIYIVITELYVQVKLGGSALDINIHDTYFVIAGMHIAQILFFLFTLLGFVYFSFTVSKVALVKTLTRIHVIITVSAVFINDIVKMILDNLDDGFILFYSGNYYQGILTVIMIIVLIAQILFIFNITYSSIKAFRLRHNN